MTSTATSPIALNSGAQPERLYNRRQTQELLGIGESKFFELLQEGRLTAVKLDGKLVIRASVITAFQNSLQAHTPAPLKQRHYRHRMLTSTPSDAA